MKIPGDGILSLLRNIDLNDERFVVRNIRRLYDDPFKFIIGVILSQNTTDRNAIKAYGRLESKLGEVSLEKILSTPLDKIAEAIRPAGLHWRRARKIRELASKIVEEFGGDLSWIRELPLEEARSRLLSLPGVGRKTADVVLLMYAGKPTFPVDTHVMRVSKRLGLVSEDAGYEDVRRVLMEVFREKDYLEAHLRMISLGRKYCRARRPKCIECPMKAVCNYYEKNVKR